MAEAKAGAASTAAKPNAESPAKEKAPKKTKGTLPEGLLTPVEYAKTMDVRPQIIYGYIRNSKSFQEAALKTDVEDSNGEKRAFVVDKAAADQWFVEKDKRKAEREAAKAAKATAEATAAAK